MADQQENEREAGAASEAEERSEEPTAPANPGGRKAGGRGGKGGKGGRGAKEGNAAGDARTAGADSGAPEVIEIRPMAGKARMRKRHWGLFLGFFLVVLLPLAVVGYYLLERTTDQYASISGFSVRKEEVASPAELLGGLSQFMGGSGDTETDMLYEYIRSQDLVEKIDARLDLWAHYTAPYQNDPVFSLKPGGTIEDLVEYWRRIARVSYDQSTGLVSIQVVAFAPEMARAVAEAIVAESQVLVNALNATARGDSLRYAEQDLEDAVARLKSAREALVHFRSRTQIVDPESDLRGRMGVLNGLQQQLAQALIEYDIIARDSAATDPRVTQAQRRIEVIRERIAEERRTFTEEESDTGGAGYPALLGEYESLTVDREFAEQNYTAALANLDIARANAARQSRYLATYISPTLPQKSEFPQRGIIFGLSALFLVLLWAILSLMFYAFRDRK